MKHVLALLAVAAIAGAADFDTTTIKTARIERRITDVYYCTDTVQYTCAYQSGEVYYLKGINSQDYTSYTEPLVLKKESRK